MGRPRKFEQDDRYDEAALNHDLTPEAIREQSATHEDAEAERLQAQHDPDAEEPLTELGEREGGGYFESLRDDDSEDDG